MPKRRGKRGGVVRARGVLGGFASAEPDVTATRDVGKIKGAWVRQAKGYYSDESFIGPMDDAELRRALKRRGRKV